MTEENPESEPKFWQDPEFQTWLKSSESPIGDLFADPTPDKPEKVSGGGQKVRPQESADTMSELVRVLTDGIKASAREEARAEQSKAPAPSPTFPKPNHRGWFFGEQDE